MEKKKKTEWDVFSLVCTFACVASFENKYHNKANMTTTHYYPNLLLLLSSSFPLPPSPFPPFLLDSTTIKIDFCSIAPPFYMHAPPFLRSLPPSLPPSLILSTPPKINTH